MNLISKYLKWLQKDVPAGEVERYPEKDKNGQTSVKGIYIIGDLTGIPLLKLAAESGKRIIDHLVEDTEFNKLKKSNSNPEVYDVIIIGAGPAGIAAGIEASKNKLNYKIFESAKRFNTIVNFPKAKPIFAEPEDYEQESELKIKDGIKETLLFDLENQVKNFNLPIEDEMMVDKIDRTGNYLNIYVKEKVFKCLRVILAIGKSGNSRMLKVPGENFTKVYNRLFDPTDCANQDVLVVGGGDSALETAIAVSEFAQSVTISYRKDSLSRPKEGNVQKLNQLVKNKTIQLLLGTNVKEIKEENVILTGKNKDEIVVDNSMVFTMIGRELPFEFFKRSKIKIEGELSFISKLQFLLLLLISGVIYFGKSSPKLFDEFLGKYDSWGAVLGSVFTANFWIRFISFPVELLNGSYFELVKYWNPADYINALIAYFCFSIAVVLGVFLLYKFIVRYYRSFSINWQTFKYIYFILVGAFFLVVFFGGRYYGIELFGKSQSFYYTGLYSLTILIFGLRRIYVRPTTYIKLQTWTLILVQVIPLFILPEIIFPWLGKIGALGGTDSFIMTQVFPGESYWRSYGFILAWPLNLWNLYNGDITTFWLLFSIIQTFVIIPYIVYQWGKGAYCGWICSCGALAETMGDEYRILAPHGSKAKRWENFGQWALLAAFIITSIKLMSILFNIEIPIINMNVSSTADFFQAFYYIGIDIVFAGVLGVGVYFFLSGRVWCRFGCPLAALMHIYTRFSKYRIFANKKKCISCNICTKVCHMGIDVMNYANKGIPMNDVECVRCSACVVNCPTQVLSFGSLQKIDTNNISYKEEDIPFLKEGDWRTGL
ncbi:NAD(P)-binding domain-containing protein [Bacteroidota bacterium]